MSFEPEIRIVGERVKVLEGRKTLFESKLPQVMKAIGRVTDRTTSSDILPEGIRLWRERGNAIAVGIELRPQRRTVRWLAEGSGASYGRRARYEDRFLAFPYIVLLIVFRDGELCGFQQLYYRTAPLRSGHEDLLLPNLYNVAQGYRQRCWLCLQMLEDKVRALPWPGKIDAVVDHVFSAAFNRSSEEHEGNSWWGSMRGLDPRVSSVEAWERASRENGLFPLEIPWKRAGTTATQELNHMLGLVVALPRLRHARDLMALMAGAGKC